MVLESFLFTIQNIITLVPRHFELPGDLLKDSLSKILVKSPLNYCSDGEQTLFKCRGIAYLGNDDVYWQF